MSTFDHENSSYQKTDSPVGQYVIEIFCGALKAFNYKNFDKCHGSEKLMIIETLHISRREPQLKTRDEYKRRELTLIF